MGGVDGWMETVERSFARPAALSGHRTFEEWGAVKQGCFATCEALRRGEGDPQHIARPGDGSAFRSVIPCSRASLRSAKTPTMAALSVHSAAGANRRAIPAC